MTLESDKKCIAHNLVRLAPHGVWVRDGNGFNWLEFMSGTAGYNRNATERPE